MSYSSTQLEAKYRMTLSRLRQAESDLEDLEVDGYGRTLHFALAELAEVIGNVEESRRHDAAKYKFTIKEGV